MIDSKKLRKGIVLSAGLGVLVKKKLDTELAKYSKKGKISKKKHADIAKKVVKKAMVEGKKIESLVVNEAVKELRVAIQELEKIKKPVKKKTVKRKTTKKKVTKKKPAKKR